MASLTTVRAPGSVGLVAVLEQGSAALPAIATSTTSGLFRVPQSDGVGVSVNGVSRLETSAGNVSVIGNVTATGPLTCTGRAVDGLPARQPTWRNLAAYADPADLKVSLTVADLETYAHAGAQTVTSAGTVRQVSIASRPTYVARDPIDAQPAIAFDRTAVQHLVGSPVTLNCGTNGGLTVVCMFKFSGTASSYESLFWVSTGVLDRVNVCRSVSSSAIVCTLRNGSTELATITLSTVAQNQWNLVAFRFRQIAGTWTLEAYRNGVKIGQSTAALALTNRTVSSVYVGRELDSNSMYNLTGAIRYLGIWDRPLSDAELAKVTEAARIYPDLQGVAPILRFLQGARDSCLVEPAADALMPGPTGFPGSTGVNGAVLLPDGRIFCPSYTGTTARLVDPRTNVVTTPAVTFPSGTAFQAGILLPNGKVFLVPRNSTFAMLFDPATETVTTSAALFPGANAYVGAVLLPDGRVYMIPYVATSALLYDYVTDTLSTPPGTFPASTFLSAVLMADGRVFCVPYPSGTTARVYDPIAQTLSTPNGTFTGTFYGGVLLPDGRVFCCPAAATTARIYDPYTNTVTTPAGTYVSGATSTGVRLPCGRVALLPWNGSTALIFDPVTETISTPRGTIAAPSSSYQGGILLPDGRVFMAPYGKTQAQYLVTGGFGFAPLPTNVLLSPWCNNNY